MANLIHTCFNLQYVYYNPLHVSSIICSSSGSWIVLMQRLVSSLSVSGCPLHRLRENCAAVLFQPVHRTATYWEWRRADHLSRGVLSTLMFRCVLFRNLVNEEAFARWGLLRPPPKKSIFLRTFGWRFLFSLTSPSNKMILTTKGEIYLGWKDPYFFGYIQIVLFAFHMRKFPDS